MSNDPMDPRRGGPTATERRLREALADPASHADLLATACNDRGLRDALLCITSRTGEWQQLAVAARTAGARAAETEQSVYGPLTVLGVTAWAAGDLRSTRAMLSAVPEHDPASRMADLAQRIAGRGIPVEDWTARMVGIPIEEAIAFRGGPAPEPQPAPAGLVSRWFHEPPRTSAAPALGITVTRVAAEPAAWDAGDPLTAEVAPFAGPEAEGPRR